MTFVNDCVKLSWAMLGKVGQTVYLWRVKMREDSILGASWTLSLGLLRQWGRQQK